MSKTVLTYSWLVKRAMSLSRRNPEAYRALMRNSGTNEMLRGVRVEWEGFGHSRHCFRIRDPQSCIVYALINGIVRDGKMYTWVSTHFTTTQYRKRITDKYLPVTLPDGVRARRNGCNGITPCTYHNADGSVAVQGTWQGGRAKKRGFPEFPLIIRDEDGKFIGGDDGLVTKLNLHNETEDYETLLHVGWFDAASVNRAAWLESIKAIPESLCDHRKMLAVAAKAYLTATRMAQKYPKMRVALFPAVPLDRPDSWLQQLRHSGNHTPQTVMGRDAENYPILYYLPEVLLYWSESARYHDQPRFVRLSMVIPPHGNPSLDPTGKAALTSRTIRGASNAGGWFESKIPLPQGYEQAYHALLCWNPADRDGRQCINRRSDYKSHEESLTQEGADDSQLILWPRHQDKVMVTLESRDISDDEIDLPMPFDTPMGMKPEEVALMFEEKMLLESLPLC